MNESQHISLKFWSDDDKPREKLMSLGKKKISNAELIAILLGSGSREESAVQLAQRILLDANNDLNTLRNHGIKEFSAYKGMGDAKSISLIAALELGYRLISESSNNKIVTISTSRDIYQYIAPTLVDLPHEEFWTIFLNVRNQVLGKKLIGKGGSTETSIDIREIFRYALEAGAVSIAVVHNHPSGSLSPSTKDKQLTHNIVEAGKLLRIPLIDHLIVGIDTTGTPNFYSFFDQGLI